MHHERPIKVFIWSNLTKDPDNETAVWREPKDEPDKGDEDEDEVRLRFDHFTPFLRAMPLHTRRVARPCFMPLRIGC